MKVSGQKVSTDRLMLGNIIDQLNILIWSKTKDAEKGRNKPKPIFGDLYKENNISVFNSSEEFEAERNRLLERSKDGN